MKNILGKRSLIPDLRDNEGGYSKTLALLVGNLLTRRLRIALCTGGRKSHL